MAPRQPITAGRLTTVAISLFVAAMMPLFALRFGRALIHSINYAYRDNPWTIEPSVAWGPWHDGSPADTTDQINHLNACARYRTGTFSSWDYDGEITEVEETGTGKRGFSTPQHVRFHVTRMLLAVAPRAAGVSAFFLVAWLAARALRNRLTARNPHGFDILPPIAPQSAASVDRDDSATATTPIIRGADHDRPE